jgi:ABC-type uncharacterized transport system auxiliary subunit
MRKFLTSLRLGLAPALLAALLASLLAAGCFGSSTTPTMQYFWIPLWRHVPPAAGEPLPVVIQVEALDVDPGYDHLRIVYRISPVEMRHYRLRQWVTKPGRLLRTALRRYFGATRRFRLVTSAPQPLPTYILRGRVVALEQVEDGKDRERWSARVAINLRLHRSSDHKVVWRMRTDATQRVKKRTPEAVVALMTKLLRQALDRELPILTGIVRQDVARR